MKKELSKIFSVLIIFNYLKKLIVHLELIVILDILKLMEKKYLISILQNIVTTPILNQFLLSGELL